MKLDRDHILSSLNDFTYAIAETAMSWSSRKWIQWYLYESQRKITISDHISHISKLPYDVYTINRSCGGIGVMPNSKICDLLFSEEFILSHFRYLRLQFEYFCFFVHKNILMETREEEEEEKPGPSMIIIIIRNLKLHRKYKWVKEFRRMEINWFDSIHQIFEQFYYYQFIWCLRNGDPS